MKRLSQDVLGRVLLFVSLMAIVFAMLGVRWTQVYSTRKVREIQRP